MKIAFAGTILLSAVALATPAYSGSQSSVCRGVTGAQRTACLNAEVERGRRELADIERRNRKSRQRPRCCLRCEGL